MENFAEIEISLYSLIESDELPGVPVSGSRDYITEIRFTDPTDQYREPGIRGAVTIDFDRLEQFEDTPKDYGVELMNQINNKSSLSDYLEPRRKSLEDRDTLNGTSTSLRIILIIDHKSPELHGVHWEGLCDYRDDSWLFSKESVLFSRYLNPRGNGRPTLRPRSELTAMIAVANPSDLGVGNLSTGGRLNEQLHPINVQDELTRAKGALVPTIPAERIMEVFRNDGVLPSKPVSLSRLVENIKEGRDILYLACHGQLSTTGEKRGAYLLLEKDADGTSEIVSAIELLDGLRDLSPNKLPRLVLLASCQSAGTEFTSDASSALQGVGALLAELGIPAVIAMQGKISMLTMADFMPAFFTELLKYGQVDLALATARSKVKNKPDAWMPVLYLGLKNGNLWYVPRVVSGNVDEAANDAIQAERLSKIWVTLRDIYPNQLTPVLGPGISERLLGLRSQFSTQWAEELKYPLDEYDREDLERVALFLAIDIDPLTAKSNYRDELRKQLVQLHKNRLSEPDQQINNLGALVKKIGEAVWRVEPDETYLKLADLDFPLYITACQDTFLAEALRAKGKNPREFTCRWREEESAQDFNNIPLDNREEPVIFYLFGKLDDSESLVLTLDDFFEYLIFVPQGKRIPDPVWTAITGKTSLFLGFEVTDWSFRILFRSIQFRGDIQRFWQRPHVAVQVNPQGERLRNQQRARLYLQRTFTQVSGKISVFWMRAEDFIAEFHQQVKGGGG